MQARADSLRVDLADGADAFNLYLSVLREVPKMITLLGGLMKTTTPSALYNMLIMNVVKSSQDVEDFSPDLMRFLSRLLRSELEVESAHIPKELTVIPPQHSFFEADGLPQIFNAILRVSVDPFEFAAKRSGLREICRANTRGSSELA